MSQQQIARSLELRATVSLARLLAFQGRRDEARAMLAEIYGWFTEGFNSGAFPLIALRLSRSRRARRRGGVS